MTADLLFIVLDQNGHIPYDAEELSLPRGSQPGEWMPDTAKPGKTTFRRYPLTTYPLETTDRWYMSTRIYLAEHRGDVKTDTRTLNGNQVRTLSCESIRLMQEITWEWPLLPQHPDIKAALISQWRKDNLKAFLPAWATLAGADLTRAYLYRNKLSEVDLRGATLQLADMRSSDISYADLRDTDLKNTTLTYATAVGAEFGNAEMRNANLTYGTFTGAHFANADMELANLSSAKLMGCDFRGANWTGARIAWADLRFTYLQGTKLAGVSFASVNLSGTDLRGVEITKQQLLECRFLDDIKLTGAIVDGDRLSAAAARTLVDELKVAKPLAFKGTGLAGLSF